LRGFIFAFAALAETRNKTEPPAAQSSSSNGWSIARREKSGLLFVLVFRRRGRRAMDWMLPPRRAAEKQEWGYWRAFAINS
jgi:hypothetical protein